MVSVRYPQFPGIVDGSAISDAFDSGFDRARAERDDRLANEAFGQYVNTLYGKQPQTLASLGNIVAPQQAAQGGIARAPLPAPMDPATARVEQAFAAQGQGRNDLSGNQIAGRFLKSVREGGVTNPYALAAIAATGKRESGFSPQNAAGTWSDPSQSGQAGTAGGIMSWRGDRLSALQQFAQQRGDNPNAPSPETQGAFLVAEDPSLIQKLQAAQSPQEAQQLMNNAWRFAGYNQQGGETAARMALAQEYAPQFGGGAPSQAALESMAVGQTMPAGAPQASQVAPQIASADQAIPVADPSSLLPPPEVMRSLFKSKDTRQLAIGLAQSAMQLRANATDPMARLNYEKAAAELNNLRNPQPKTTDDMREYQLARQQGFNGSFVDFKLAQKKAGATTINNNVGGNSSEFMKKSDEAAAKRLDEIVAAGQSAPQTMADMQQLVDLGSAIGTGKSAQATALLGPYAEALGFDISNLDDIQAYEAITSRLAPQMRAVGSGASSDRDVALFFKSLPSLKNTQGGNEIIANTMKAVAQNKMNAAELASSAQRGEISWQEADKKIRQLPNPYDLFKQFQKETDAGKAKPAPAANRQRAHNPQTGQTVEWDGNQWVPVQ